MDAAEVALVRSSFEAALRDTPADEFAAVLAKLGWHELCDAEPAVAVAELFEAQGRMLAATPALDVIVAAALGTDLPDGAAVVHPGLANWEAPPGSVSADGVVAVDGLVLSGSARSELLLVPCRTTTGRLGLLETPTGALECTPVAGFDETLRLVRVRGRAADAAAPLTPIGPWGAATAAARRALAHELIGLARQMLDDAARHVTDREQFGRPIAVFQAVRHRLADGHVAVVSSRAVLDDAWTAGDQAALAADAAKALAGRAALAAGRHCLQVTGAIGFTWEHDLHRRIRRVHLLDGLYGASDGLAAAIGAGLLAGGGPVPRIGGGEL